MRRNLIVTTLALAALPLFGQDRGTRHVPGSGVIDEPGSYIITGGLPGKSNAGTIVIAANDVSLNLNGHTLSGQGGNQGIGVHIRSASGVRVTNGNLSNFAVGLLVEGSRNVHIENLLVRGQGLAVSAPPPETGIMIIQSRNVAVVNNGFYNVGLGVFVRGGMSSGNRIAGNTITAGTNGALGICYNPAPADSSGPRGDLVYGNLITGFGTGIQMSENSAANVLKENTIAYRMMAVDIRNVTNLDIDNTKVQLP